MGQTADTPPASPPQVSLSLSDQVLEHRLRNGMQLLMVVNRQAPIVSLMLTFRVGSVDEREGETGIAHLFEHMAFKGTRTLGTTNYRKERRILEKMEEVDRQVIAEKARGEEADRERIGELQDRFQSLQEEAGRWVVSNELGEIYKRHGSVGFNAGTGKDYTQYMVSLPANRLPLWAEIESDRMVHTVLREFYRERDVVLEERRLRVDNSPSGRLYEGFLSAAFQVHPYRNPTIGWAEDVASMSPAATRDFFHKHYAPSNAVLAIVGDIDPAQTVRLIESKFGKIPGRPRPAGPESDEPEQRGERRVKVEYEASPRVLIGYHMPEIGHQDTFVLDVINSILSEGRTSRLYRRLVQEEQVALSISTSTNVPGARYPGLFVFSASPRIPHTTADVEEAIYEELERLKQEPVRERELARVLNQLDAYLVRSLETNRGLAAQLAYFEVVAGSWRYLMDVRQKMAQVRPEDVMRVAQKYFASRHRTVATLVRPSAED